MPLTREQRKHLIDLLLAVPPASNFAGRTALLGAAGVLGLDRNENNARTDLDGIVSQLERLRADDLLVSLIENAASYVPGTVVAAELQAMSRSVTIPAPATTPASRGTSGIAAAAAGVLVAVMGAEGAPATAAATRIGTYEILRTLARSKSGGVYVARCAVRGTEVALKVMLAKVAVNAAARDAFLREVEVIRGLRHPNIVNLIEYGSGGSGFWFAMELCRGGSVEQLLSRRGGKLAVREGVALVLEALEGLEAAHTRGFVHRDLEPGNLLFEHVDGGPLKIANFGLAKSFQSAGLSGFTVTGASAGAPEFMPREQVINFKYSKPPSDVWSMAAILYLVLTGRLPRDVEPTEDPLSAVLSSPVVPILQRSRSVPPRLAEVIDRCLSPNVAARPVDAADMKRCLQAAL